MRYYMSVDGGGTKLTAILFDDCFRLCGLGRGGPINPNFERMEDIEATMKECIAQCLDGRKGIRIERIYISMPGPSRLFVELLRNAAELGEALVLSEGRMSLLAGLQCRRGMVALAGTGSGIFWIDGDEQQHLGGWGSLLGDEGSAYDIGRRGLIAAIRAYEGRGAATLLQDLVRQEWQLEKMWDMVSKVYGARSARAVIASAARIVSKAAHMGDQTALEIFEEAGREMAKQTLTMLCRINVQMPVPVTISGGAWKGCRRMFDQFEKMLKHSYSTIDIRLPLFEPVMAGIVAEGLMGKEKMNMDVLHDLTKEFREFLYQSEW